MRRVRRGDEELNFTPEEQACVQEAEGGVRRPRYRRAAPHRHAGRAAPHGEGGEGLAIGFVIACILVVFLIGLDEVRTADRARTTQRARAGALPSPPPRAESKPTPRTSRTPQPQKTRPRKHPRRSGYTFSYPLAPPARARDYLPPGWATGQVAGQLQLRVAPSRNARVLGSVPAGTKVLVRRIAGERPQTCWHAVVAVSGRFSGTACFTPGVDRAAKRRWPLPEGWGRTTLNGRPVVIRPISQNRYFMITADGRAWGGNYPMEPNEFLIARSPRTGRSERRNRP